jgi:hypothetical protein
MRESLPKNKPGTTSGQLRLRTRLALQALANQDLWRGEGKRRALQYIYHGSYHDTTLPTKIDPDPFGRIAVEAILTARRLHEPTAAEQLDSAVNETLYYTIPDPPFKEGLDPFQHLWRGYYNWALVAHPHERSRNWKLIPHWKAKMMDQITAWKLTCVWLSAATLVTNQEQGQKLLELAGKHKPGAGTNEETILKVVMALGVRGYTYLPDTGDIIGIGGSHGEHGLLWVPGGQNIGSTAHCLAVKKCMIGAKGELPNVYYAGHSPNYSKAPFMPIKAKKVITKPPEPKTFWLPDDAASEGGETDDDVLEEEQKYLVDSGLFNPSDFDAPASSSSASKTGSPKPGPKKTKPSKPKAAPGPEEVKLPKPEDGDPEGPAPASVVGKTIKKIKKGVRWALKPHISHRLVSPSHDTVVLPAGYVPRELTEEQMTLIATARTMDGHRGYDSKARNLTPTVWRKLKNLFKKGTIFHTFDDFCDENPISSIQPEKQVSRYFGTGRPGWPSIGNIAGRFINNEKLPPGDGYSWQSVSRWYIEAEARVRKGEKDEELKMAFELEMRLSALRMSRECSRQRASIAIQAAWKGHHVRAMMKDPCWAWRLGFGLELEKVFHPDHNTSNRDRIISMAIGATQHTTGAWTRLVGGKMTRVDLPHERALYKVWVDREICRGNREYDEAYSQYSRLVYSVETADRVEITLEQQQSWREIVDQSSKYDAIPQTKDVVFSRARGVIPPPNKARATAWWRPEWITSQRETPGQSKPAQDHSWTHTLATAIGNLFRKDKVSLSTLYELRDECLANAKLDAGTQFYIQKSRPCLSDPRRLENGCLNPVMLDCLVTKRGVYDLARARTVHLYGQTYHLYSLVPRSRNLVLRARCCLPKVHDENPVAYFKQDPVRLPTVMDFICPNVDAQYRSAYALYGPFVRPELRGILNDNRNEEFAKEDRSGVDPANVAGALERAYLRLVAASGFTPAFSLP